MANDSLDLLLVWNVFSSLIFPLITLVVSILYITKKPGVDGFLIAGGSLIHLFTGIFFSLIWPSIIRNTGQSMTNISLLSTIVGVISFIGSVLYVTGIIILIFNHLALYKRMQN
jgi:hypothetical protein